MKIIVNTTFECETKEEYKEAIDSIEQEQADMEDLNEINGTDDSLEIIKIDKENLSVNAIAVYNK